MTLSELETTFSTPVGSGIFTVVAVLAIFTLVLALLRHYLPLRSTPAYVTLPVFLALALPASAILLVPIDLASSPPDSATPSGIWLSKRVMLVSWRIVYWLTFVLTWVILPFLGEYLDSGYRTPKARILYSIRSNGRYQLIVLGSGVIGLIYITVQNGLDFTSLRSLVMALAYVWGLVMAIYLMGHGLVALPRRLWLDVNTGNKLKRIQARAPQVHERLTDSVTNLEDVCSQIKHLQRRKPGVAPFLQDWIDELSEIAHFSEPRLPQTGNFDVSTNNVPSVITERYLANLTRKLHRTRHQNARFMDGWGRLVRRAGDCQAILNSHASKHLEFGPHSAHSSGICQLPFITPYIRYHIFVNILPATRAVFAGIFSLASVCVVWSELIKTFAVFLSVIGISVTKVHSKSDQIGFFGQVIASGWILYMCAAVFVGVNDAKVWGNRALVPRNTYGESACWYAGLIARLTVPLAYNFVTFLPRDVQRRTTFYEFLGRLINLTPLGKGFDYFFPIFILFPICATQFNLYGKIQTTFGLADGGIDDDLEGNPGGFGSGGWREGQALIDQELGGPGFLGLSSRPAGNSSAPLGSNHVRVPRSAPTLWVPPAQSSSSNDQESSRLRRTRNTTPQRPLEEDEEEEENFFQSFAHRVRNTIDTTSKPKWLQDVDAGFKRPRWMGGSADDGDEPTRPSDHTGGVGRWFGGQPGDGRLRL